MPYLPVPTTNNPVTIHRLISQVGRVIDTPGFRSWYESKRRKCPDAPHFDDFWRYLKASLRYDVPGEELCEVIWRATRKAFIRFNLARGDQAKPPHQRFLTHWRYQFRDAVRSTFGRVRTNPTLKAIESAASQSYSADPFQVLLRKEVRCLMEQLTGDEKTIIELHYIDGVSLVKIAKRLRRRNAYVTQKHNEVLERMRRAL